MKRVPLRVIALSFPAIALSLVGCQQQDAAPVTETPSVSEPMSEVHNTLGTQAQQTLEAITRDNERQQVNEALHREQQKQLASHLSVDDE